MPTLEEMTIKLDGIGHALSDTLLSVPLYQRSYAWEDRHVADFLQDVGFAISRNEKEYFLGTIVITRHTAERPEIADGQQRLATTTVLLAAIRDWFALNGDADRAADIESTFLWVRDLRSQEVNPRLKLNQVDQDFFTKTILVRPGVASRATAPSKESQRKLARAAELAKNHVAKVASITGRPVDTLIDWIEYLRQKAKVIWVSVPSYANAFTIFETLNDRGLELAISDLLKNHLFNVAGDRIEEAQQSWVTMLGSLEATGKENIVVDFIRHYWSSRQGATRERELYESIKKSITSKQSAVDLAAELSNNALVYSAMLNPQHEMWKKYGATAKDHMVTINLLRMVQIRPLIMSIIAQFSIAETKKVLPLMVAWGVRFLVVGGLGGGTLEYHYSERAKEVRSAKIKTKNELIAAMKDVVPSDGQFEAALLIATVSASYLGRYYLRALENQAKGIANPELVPNPNEEIVNLEHVLPENPGTNWPSISPEDAEANFRKLGNLALLASKKNLDIGNEPFSAKKAIYKASAFKLTKAIARKADWGLAEIADRQRTLTGLALNTWPSQ